MFSSRAKTWRCKKIVCLCPLFCKILHCDLEVFWCILYTCVPVTLSRRRCTWSARDLKCVKSDYSVNLRSTWSQSQPASEEVLSWDRPLVPWTCPIPQRMTAPSGILSNKPWGITRNKKKHNSISILKPNTRYEALCRQWLILHAQTVIKALKLFDNDRTKQTNFKSNLFRII